MVAGWDHTVGLRSNGTVVAVGGNDWGQCNTFDWHLLSLADLENITAEGSLLYADFGSDGLWQWDGETWTYIAASNPENIVANPDNTPLYADFGQDGVWVWNGTAWSKIPAVRGNIVIPEAVQY